MNLPDTGDLLEQRLLGLEDRKTVSSKMTYKTLRKKIAPANDWKLGKLNPELLDFAAELAYTLPNQLHCWPIKKLKYLGGGCYGSVWQINKNRALKIFYGNWTDNTKTSVTKLLKVRSPHIYRVLDYWKVGKIQFLLMPVYRKARTNKDYARINDLQDAVYEGRGQSMAETAVLKEIYKYKIDTTDVGQPNIVFGKKNNLVLIDLI